MAYVITCKACGDKRRAIHKNTTHCVRCGLLRDLLFTKDRRYDCDNNCGRQYTPVATRDPFCGVCSFGCGLYGHCAACRADPEPELHRPNVPICVRCLRDPKQRNKIIRALRNGQQERRAANNHVPPRREEA